MPYYAIQWKFHPIKSDSKVFRGPILGTSRDQIFYPFSRGQALDRAAIMNINYPKALHTLVEVSSISSEEEAQLREVHRFKTIGGK